MLHSIAKPQMGALRALSGNKNSRLIETRSSGRGRIISDMRRSSPNTRPVTPSMVDWLKKNKMVEEQHSDDSKLIVLKVTPKGHNYAVRDIHRRGSPRRKDRQTEGPAVKDLLLKRLRRIGPDGATAADLKNWLSSEHNIDTHYKTVGMSLYRFSVLGLVRRKGWVWKPTAKLLNTQRRKKASNDKPTLVAA